MRGRGAVHQFLICTPLEWFWPLTSWPKPNSIAADVAYAFFVRIVLLPLIAFFEYDWLRLNLDGFLRAHIIAPPSLSGLFPLLASWPAWFALGIEEARRLRSGQRHDYR